MVSPYVSSIIDTSSLPKSVLSARYSKTVVGGTIIFPSFYIAPTPRGGVHFCLFLKYFGSILSRWETFLTSTQGVNLDDKSLVLNELFFWKKIIFLVNLTFAVYISSSGCTLTFGDKREDSLRALPLQPADGDGV